MTRAVGALAIAAIAGCGSSSPPDAAQPETVFVVVQQKLDAVVLGIGGFHDDVVLVGGIPGGGPGSGRILRYRGGSWSEEDALGAPTLWWTFAASPDDRFIVGESGTILHGDGTSWERRDGDRDYALWGVWGASKDDVWAVGGHPNNLAGGVLLHGDGTSFAPFASGIDPLPNLFKVWGTAADDVWFVGASGTLLHWDGVHFASYGLGIADPLVTIRGRAADDVFAVGGLSSPVLLHERANGWNRVLLDPTLPGLNGVWTQEGSPAYAVGYHGLMLSDASGAFTVLDSPTTESLHVVWGDGAGTVLAGGGNLLGSAGSPAHGVVVATPDVAAGPIAESDGGADAGVQPDASPLEAGADADGGGLPAGADCAEAPTGCAPGLDCWLVAGSQRFVCTHACADASECAASLGASACCAIPGPQTLTTVCIPQGLSGCP